MFGAGNNDQVKFAETAVFVGCARDCERFLPHVLTNVECIATMFSETAFVIIENDSRDGTKSLLERWAQAKANAGIVCLDGLVEIGARTLRLEIARNTYIEMVRADPHISKFDLMFVLDFDDASVAPLNMEMVAAAVEFLKSNSDHAAVFSNSLGTYYDVWALRQSSLCPRDVWESVCDFAVANNVADDIAFAKSFAKVSFATSQPPVEVDSAFGGLGIYKLSYVLRNPNPYLGYKVKAIRGPNSGQKIVRWQKCEHVHFNQGLRSLGGRLFVLPQLISSDATRYQFSPSFWRSLAF